MSRNVRVKEEPVDFECSPFELLGQIGEGDDVTRKDVDVTGQSDDVTEMVIKQEYEGLVKTEVCLSCYHACLAARENNVLSYIRFTVF